MNRMLLWFYQLIIRNPVVKEHESNDKCWALCFKRLRLEKNRNVPVLNKVCGHLSVDFWVYEAFSSALECTMKSLTDRQKIYLPQEKTHWKIDPGIVKFSTFSFTGKLFGLLEDYCSDQVRGGPHVDLFEFIRNHHRPSRSQLWARSCPRLRLKLH